MSLPPGYNLLAKYNNPVYVETGIWKGDSLSMAVQAGFMCIVGIDYDPECINYCAERFEGLELFQMNSPDALKLIKYEDPTTYFFDAHWQFLEGTDPGPNPFPLLDEIKAISDRRHPDDVVIIDDWHIFYPDRVGYSKDDIKSALITAGFSRFTFVANPVIDGILIAQR